MTNLATFLFGAAVIFLTWSVITYIMDDNIKIESQYRDAKP